MENEEFQEDPNDNEEVEFVDVERKKKEIDKILKEKREKNNVVLKDAHTRNIIFVGRTRAGKSQVLRTLKDPFKFNEELSLYSETKEPSLHSFTMEYSEANAPPINFNFNIMDTPGLFEQTMDNATARDNNIIMSTITKCLRFEIRKIHHIFFVCSFVGGINMEDVESILKLNELFKGANRAVSLMVTRCESKQAKARENLEKQIRTIPQLKEFFESSDIKIFFVGALDNDDYESGAVDSIRQKTNTVLFLRTHLYKHLFKEQEPCHITELDFYKKQNIEGIREQLEKFKGTEEEKRNLQKYEEENDRYNILSNAVSMTLSSRLTEQKAESDEIVKKPTSPLKYPIDKRDIWTILFLFYAE